MSEKQYHVGAQNDQLYIIRGEPPALNNDYPNHDADREPVAKIYGDGDEALRRARIMADALNVSAA